MRSPTVLFQWRSSIELKPNILAWSLLGRLMSTDGHIKASEKEQREFFQEQYLPSLEMMKEATDNVPIGFWLCEPLSAEAATEAARGDLPDRRSGARIKDLPLDSGSDRSVCRYPSP